MSVQHIVLVLSLLVVTDGLEAPSGGFCRTEIKNGKLVSTGNCKKQNSVFKDLDEKLAARKSRCRTGGHDCSPNAICIDKVDSFECKCKDGFTGHGKVCTDIDECATESHDCSPEATCTNTIGNYECTCNTFYNGTGKVCKICHVVNNSRCFWVDEHGVGKLNYSTAEGRCALDGGMLSGIYSNEHSQKILNYLKGLSLPSTFNLWTGLTHVSGNFLNPDGTVSPNFSGESFEGTNKTGKKVAYSVPSNRKSFSHLFLSEYSKLYGCICERRS